MVYQVKLLPAMLASQMGTAFCHACSTSHTVYWKNRRQAECLVPCCLCGRPGRSFLFWLWPGPALTIVNQQREDLPLCLSLFLALSDKEIFTIFIALIITIPPWRTLRHRKEGWAFGCYTALICCL